MFTEKDFTLDKIDTSDGHEDYWFKTSNEADKVLLDRHFEQGCEHVFEVVYSMDEDVVGIKRQFLWNWDVVMSDDEELKTLLKTLATKSK